VWRRYVEADRHTRMVEKTSGRWVFVGPHTEVLWPRVEDVPAGAHACVIETWAASVDLKRVGLALDLIESWWRGEVHVPIAVWSDAPYRTFTKPDGPVQRHRQPTEHELAAARRFAAVVDEEAA
jgi:hypothetical protein